MLVADELHTLHEGNVLFVPPNAPHAFAPAYGQDADFLVAITPSKPRFGYYRVSLTRSPPEVFARGTRPGSIARPFRGEP